MSMIASNKLECRKVRKPKIEKLRRARINSSLESLKAILLRNTISIPQGTRPTKLEKADILEMTVRYVEMLHEKLSISCERPSRKSMETFGAIQWNTRHERAFCDITNQMDKRHQQTSIVSDDKAWFTSRLHLHHHRPNARNNFDKENLADTMDRENENQSMLGEHWRPWWWMKKFFINLSCSRKFFFVRYLIWRKLFLFLFHWLLLIQKFSLFFASISPSYSPSKFFFQLFISLFHCCLSCFKGEMRKEEKKTAK